MKRTLIGIAGSASILTVAMLCEKEMTQFHWGLVAGYCIAAGSILFHVTREWLAERRAMRGRQIRL